MSRCRGIVCRQAGRTPSSVGCQAWREGLTPERIEVSEGCAGDPPPLVVRLATVGEQLDDFVCREPPIAIAASDDGAVKVRTLAVWGEAVDEAGPAARPVPPPTRSRRRSSRRLSAAAEAGRTPLSRTDRGGPGPDRSRGLCVPCQVCPSSQRTSPLLSETSEETIALFTDLGLTVLSRATVSGDWTDTAVGLDGNHAKIAMLQTPDGNGCPSSSSTSIPMRSRPNRPSPTRSDAPRRLLRRRHRRRLEIAAARLPPCAAWRPTKTSICLTYVRGPSGDHLHARRRADQNRGRTRSFLTTMRGGRCRTKNRSASCLRRHRPPPTGRLAPREPRWAGRVPPFGQADADPGPRPGLWRGPATLVSRPSREGGPARRAWSAGRPRSGPRARRARRRGSPSLPGDHRLGSASRSPAACRRGSCNAGSRAGLDRHTAALTRRHQVLQGRGWGGCRSRTSAARPRRRPSRVLASSRTSALATSSTSSGVLSPRNRSMAIP